MRQRQLRAILGSLHRLADPDRGGPDDGQLLDQWRNQRDKAAFEVLVWRHGSMVWNLCRRILGREQDVEDAFQATFLTFLRKADTIAQGRFLSSWLYKVAYRIALEVRAAPARQPVHGPLDADLAAVEPPDDGWDELGPVLDEEVNRLPEKYRLPFVLCYLEGKTTDEAAQDLGCPRGTVGTRLAWARERLRSRLTRRGLALSAMGLAALLAEKAAAATVPAPLVANAVKAAILPTVGKAVAVGAISERAAALSQGAVQAMFMAKIKTTAVVLFMVGVLGGGTGMLTHQALATKAEKSQSAEAKQRALGAEERVLANRDDPGKADEDNPVADREGEPPTAQDKEEAKFDPPSPQLSGTLVGVDGDGKGFSLEVPTRAQSGVHKIEITDKTQLVFGNVGPDEARLTEGYRADVWLEKDSKDVAACVQLRGRRDAAAGVMNEKILRPHRVGQVVGVAADGKGLTLEKLAKGEAAAKTVIRLTEKTGVSFFNVARGGAGMTEGYEARVWLEENTEDTAKVVGFFGAAEEKPSGGKGKRPNHSGRVVGVSGKVLTVQVPSTVKGETTTIAIKLTDAVRESYHGVPADGAKPTEGYHVQIWLVESSEDVAARLRFTPNGARKRVDGKIVAVSADGARLTVESQPGEKGKATRREIKVVAKTSLVFFDVGLGGTQLTEGDHVRGWLTEGAADNAEELMVSRPAAEKK